MYCPNCGNQNSTDQKFCRSCGLGLQKVAQTLGEQLPTKLDVSLQQKKERFEKLGLAALGIFGGGLLIPILYSIIYTKMWIQGKIMAGLGSLAMVVLLGFGLLAAILFAKANEVKEAAAKRPSLEPAELNSGVETRELPAYSAPARPVFSVVDRTTELLPRNKNQS
jgi:uncharacterized membrane protein YvbJ